MGLLPPTTLFALKLLFPPPQIINTNKLHCYYKNKQTKKATKRPPQLNAFDLDQNALEPAFCFSPRTLG